MWNLPSPPDGLAAAVEIGWPTMSGMLGVSTAQIADVQLGRVTLPQLYSVTVHPDPFDATDAVANWALVLQFMIDKDAEEARLQSALAVELPVDIALKRVKDAWSIHEIQQWAESLIVADRLQTEPDDMTHVEVAEAFAQFEQILAPRQRRTRVTITNSHLREVADVYTAEARKPGGKPTTAVQNFFSTSHSNAARWVSMARKKGLIEPR